MLFISGFIFLLCGIFMKFKPPKKINMWYGYRTPLSTSSDRAWQLAQQHSTKAMFKYSLIMMLVGLFTGIHSLTERYVTEIILIEVIILLPLFTILMILSTHKYLKRML